MPISGRNVLFNPPDKVGGEFSNKLVKIGMGGPRQRAEVRRPRNAGRSGAYRYADSRGEPNTKVLAQRNGAVIRQLVDCSYDSMHLRRFHKMSCPRQSGMASSCTARSTSRRSPRLLAKRLTVSSATSLRP